MKILLFCIGFLITAFVSELCYRLNSYEGLLKDFHRRPNWRKLSYLVKVIHKKKHGYLFCECCKVKEGDIHPETGKEPFFQTDHIVARSVKPELALQIGNCQILCDWCNMAKSNIDFTDWRE